MLLQQINLSNAPLNVKFNKSKLYKLQLAYSNYYYYVWKKQTMFDYEIFAGIYHID